MSNIKSKPGLIFVITVIFAGAFFRFIPHWPNFTPIAAMALFGGAYLGRKHLAFIVPFAAMFLSDLILGLHKDMWAVYLAFGVTVFIGTMIRNNIKVFNVISASIISSVIFFLLTNFSAWLSNPLYPRDFSGLMQSYIAGLAFFNNGTMGISFFLNEISGALFYNGIFFGIYAFAKQKFPVLSQTA
jgi:TctA family transporter